MVQCMNIRFKHAKYLRGVGRKMINVNSFKANVLHGTKGGRRD